MDYDFPETVGNGMEKSSQLLLTPSFFRGVGRKTTNQEHLWNITRGWCPIPELHGNFWISVQQFPAPRLVSYNLHFHRDSQMKPPLPQWFSSVNKMFFGPKSGELTHQTCLNIARSMADPKSSRIHKVSEQGQNLRENHLKHTADSHVQRRSLRIALPHDVVRGISSGFWTF